MKMTAKNFEFEPHGVCPRKIRLELEQGRIHRVEFLGGCDGNLQGICRLVQGMGAQEVISRLMGVKCGQKPTSCPDQLAQALAIALREHEQD